MSERPPRRATCASYAGSIDMRAFFSRREICFTMKRELMLCSVAAPPSAAPADMLELAGLTTR